MKISNLPISLLVIVLMSSSYVRAEQSGRTAVANFFEQHCIGCHGEKKPKGELRLDTLKWDLSNNANLELWQAVYDQLESQDMPPEDEPQPKAVARAEVLKAIAAGLEEARSTGPRNTVVLRRLNRSRYRNTIRDLLDVDVLLNDPTALFPSDESFEGFDVIGEKLVMSDFLMRQQIAAAQRAVDLACYPGAKPAVSTIRMGDKHDKRTEALFASKAAPPGAKSVFLFMNDERYPGDIRGQHLYSSASGVSVKGWYDFEIEVEARGRDFEKVLPQKLAKYHAYHPEELHQLEIYLVGAIKAGNNKNPERHMVEAIDLPDNERIRLKRRYWLDKGCRVSLAFGNGIYTSMPGYAKMIGLDLSIESKKLQGNKAPFTIQELRRLAPKLIHIHLGKVDGPRIVVHDASKTGPIFEQWPPQSHRIVHGRPGDSRETVIRNFARRAFRRPLEDGELTPYFQLAKHGPEGIRSAIAAILCSPSVVYMYEAEGKLDSYEIAARLAYFLTDTMPDDELTALAEKGVLTDPAVLKGQALRLLADSRSDAFVENFIWSWLKLQSTREMAPGVEAFPVYYANHIVDSMVVETNSFFRHLITDNLSVSNLIDSDFTYLNSNLGRHYGIDGVDTSSEFKLVALKPEHRRGGLLGQASVLTASADGVATSPVTRGAWILNNLLGTPPKPPPADLDTILAPDTRGASTIRERLAKHRVIESCNECHKSIDPIGFALEQFDPIGARRTKYGIGTPARKRRRRTPPTGQAIDASGHMPNGDAFTDVQGLKSILMKDLTLPRRNLITKLLTYGTGRTMAVTDRSEIDRIGAVVEKKGDGVRDLILELISSSIFLNK